MISQESMRYSLRNLRKRKARSFLTILSIFVGITSIFIFISFGIGLYNYVNEFTTGNGRDVASVSNMANWASFDSDDTWVADYEKLYGKGSWKTAMATIVDSTDAYSEEVRERQAE